MTFKEYRENLKIFQSYLLDFLDFNHSIETNFTILLGIINDKKLDDDQYKIKTILYLISRIVDHHHRKKDFFSKIERVLKIFKGKIIFYFTNYEIYNFFKNNKRILLFLMNEGIINIDEIILNEFSKGKYKSYDYHNYFSPEIDLFVKELMSDMDDDEGYIELDDSDNIIDNKFDENRKKGENEKFVFNLIRNDMINEFRVYVDVDNYPLNSTIIPSIYESNLFLLQNKDTSLIEYAAFFGSIQIFKYLYSEKVDITPRIWLYAIHSNNEELILFMEYNKKDFPISSSEECFKEAIKCHHNSIACYFQNNFIDQSEMKNKIENNYKENTYSYGFHYYNFFYLPEYLINNKFIFYYACEYNYYHLVELLMKIKVMDLNLKIIFKKFFILK